jgi:hypothetical protein
MKKQIIFLSIILFFSFMVSAYSQTVLVTNTTNYIGLSTDLKPVLEERDTGSTFFVSDLQIKYTWFNMSWVPELTTDFVLKVSEGEVPGHSFERKFGKVDDLASGVPTDIWEYGVNSGSEVYQWSPKDVADIDTISSSNSGDAQNTYIKGLDGDGIQVEQFAILDGQNKVALTTPLNRINRISNVSGIPYSGDVYVYVDTAISGGIPTDKSQLRGYVSAVEGGTLQSFYTTPAGHRAFNYWIEASLAKGGGATAVGINMKPRVRPYGGVFVTVNEFNLVSTGSSYINPQFAVPLVFPARADFVPVATSTANGVGASFGFGIILIEDGY